jgi:cytochrome c553
MARITHATLLVALGFAAVFPFTACTSMSETLLGGDGGTGGNAGGAGGAGGGTGGASQTGVPCDVAKVLADKCLSCHGAKPSGGAPMSLVTYENLTAPSKADPSKKYVERAVIRMQDQQSPMPPGGGATADDVAVLQKWIDAGTPKGDCGMPANDPFSAPVGCVSGKNWVQMGGDGSSTMNPGLACIACHKKQGGEAPIFNVAGTVYPLGHESDLCYGINGTSPDYQDVVVEITDANNVVYNLHPGPTGNFSLRKSGLAYPYKAKVKSSKGERAMSEAQTDGDCNGCHTVDGGGNGSKAPGRIVVPL